LSPTAAAVEAGYPKKSAGKRAWYLMRRPEIREAISQLQEERLADADLSAARVLEELRRVAFADFRALFDTKGRLKPVSEWMPEQAAAVAQCEGISGNADAGDQRHDCVVRVKTWDKTKALEILAKHFGLLMDKTEVMGGIAISWLPANSEIEVVAAESVQRVPLHPKVAPKSRP
jgi:phage terminase small subunit